MTARPCPVCDAELVQTYFDAIEGAVCEYADSCPRGCVESEFAYGHHRDRIGDRTWEYSYVTDGPAYAAMMREMHDAIQELRRTTAARGR